MQAKLGHGPGPLHEVEGHQGQGLTFCGLSKAEDIKMPVVLRILNASQQLVLFMVELM